MQADRNQLNCLNKNEEMKLKEKSEYADTLNNLGIMLENIGETTNAIEKYQSALKIYHESYKKSRLFLI